MEAGQVDFKFKLMFAFHFSQADFSEDVEILVAVPAGTKGKHIKVTFKPTQLTIKTPETDLDMKLFAKVCICLFVWLFGWLLCKPCFLVESCLIFFPQQVAVDDCTWSVADGTLAITLTKQEADATWPVLSRDD